MNNYANRGKSLETLIEHANEQYKAKGVALIQKVATPWKVIRRGKQIVSAFPAEKSTVDFVGVCDGQSIAFDAKECKSETSFPLSNIEQHQMDFLREWERQGGKSFLIIEMVELRKIFKAEFGYISQYWYRALKGGRKSISVKDFEKFQVIGQGGGVVLDYLEMYRGG